MPTITIPKITAITLTPNPVDVSTSYTVVATVIEEQATVTINPLFEFPMDIGSSGQSLSEIIYS